MSEQKCRKVYVPVNLDVDAEGNIRLMILLIGLSGQLADSR